MGGTGTADILIEGLLGATAYPHPVQDIILRETHISWVLLTGPFVYKLKKPVDFGFLDYTTLERRRHFCEEEVRLNRRFAPDLYLGVVPVTGRPDAPHMDGDGTPIEYAVKMRQFDEAMQLDRVLARGELTGDHIDGLARHLAAFHCGADVARPGQGVGGAEQVAAAVRANFELTRRFVPDLIDPETYAALSEWSETELVRLQGIIAQRLADGFVRECHGDAHLRNMALLDGEIILFDCIEFNPAFRYTDVMAEVAFTRMDLDAMGAKMLGARFLSAYLEESGDYEGLALLPLYLSYRAYVRGKVAALSPETSDGGRADTVRRQVSLANGYTRPQGAFLIVMHGVTGSGKSTVAGALVEELGAVRIRSDRERKRLTGVTHGQDAVGEGIYDADTTARTYRRLLTLSETPLIAGFPVILDATYLDVAERDAARALAERLRVPFAIVSCEAPRAVLEQRVAARAEKGEDRRDPSDATLPVLAAQLADYQPVTAPERDFVVTVDTESFDSRALADRLRARWSGSRSRGAGG
ncbi:MAG: AAA family ATPase [Leptospirillia bacterium]